VVGGGGPVSAAITYPPGWNLAGLPAGTTLPVDAYAWDPSVGRYSTIVAGTVLAGGRGYWVYFSSSRSVQPAADSLGLLTVQAPAGGWIMIGNPSSSVAAGVVGADVLFVWDPNAGAYQAVSRLQPGQGAWALSISGGTIAIAPGK